MEVWGKRERSHAAHYGLKTSQPQAQGNAGGKVNFAFSLYMKAQC
jgi:hypothetical protein